MLSILIPARNGRDMTADCLRTTLSSLRANGLEDTAEWVLLDDESDPSMGITDLFKGFRAETTAPVHIYRFKKRQHYSRIFAHGLSRARGDEVLFISNDMRMTPAFLRTVLAVAKLDEKIGIVSGISAYCDSREQHALRPDREMVTYEEECAFAEQVAAERGLAFVDERLLSGDAVLIKRALIKRIGVFDPEYPSYFGDQDYGLRAQRVGSRIVCATGAWLVHLAEGYVREGAKAEGKDIQQARLERRGRVDKAYQVFRKKWDPKLPPNFQGTLDIKFEQLRDPKRRVPAMLYVSPLKLDPAEVEAVGT